MYELGHVNDQALGHVGLMGPDLASYYIGWDFPPFIDFLEMVPTVLKGLETLRRGKPQEGWRYPNQYQEMLFVWIWDEQEAWRDRKTDDQPSLQHVNL